jgi:2,3-bisphosphoglycerate-dependent phosphoglycerate mutase
MVAERLSGRPIAAIYTSPSRRSVETVEPLARCLGLRPELVPDLRERELPAVPAAEFEALVREAWSAPDQAPRGGESNVRAQIRGLAVVRTVAERHVGSQVVLATHGNLLALVLNALDQKFSYEFWRRLSFPDIYQLTFAGAELRRRRACVGRCLAPSCTKNWTNGDSQGKILRSSDPSSRGAA